MAAVTTTRIRERRVFVQIRGELDEASRADVERTLLELVEQADVTVDLTRAGLADPASTRMLIACRERAAASGFNLRLLNGPREVRRLFEPLEHDHQWRPGRSIIHGDTPPAPSSPLVTTADKERSDADSEQIVRLQCALCGHATFRPEGAAISGCPECGGPLRPVAIFRDRRRVQLPVEEDRRRDDD